jgi:hypothetical protein
MQFSIPQNSAKKEITNLWHGLKLSISIPNDLLLFSIMPNPAKSNNLFVAWTQFSNCYFVFCKILPESNSLFVLNHKLALTFIILVFALLPSILQNSTTFSYCCLQLKLKPAEYL